MILKRDPVAFVLAAVIGVLVGFHRWDIAAGLFALVVFGRLADRK